MSYIQDKQLTFADVLAQFAMVARGFDSFNSRLFVGFIAGRVSRE
jgi:hypothetical protein